MQEASKIMGKLRNILNDCYRIDYGRDYKNDSDLEPNVTKGVRMSLKRK